MQQRKRRAREGGERAQTRFPRLAGRRWWQVGGVHGGWWFSPLLLPDDRIGTKKNPLRWLAPEGQILGWNQHPSGAQRPADTTETTTTEMWQEFTASDEVQTGCMITGTNELAW